MNRLIAAGVVVVIALYLLFSSIYVVNVRQQAIVLRFGQINAVRTEPGLYFKLPTSLLDTVQIIEDRLLRYDFANMQLQASGQQAAQSLRAIADRQAVEIVAAANKDSEILRGEGDATRSAIYAQAYGADPEFFEFYRSLQSYRTALGPTGTTMVLSPNSEFFQYFNKDMIGDTLPTPAAPQGNAPLPSTSATVEEPSDTLPPNNVGAPTSDVTLPAAPAADVTA